MKNKPRKKVVVGSVYQKTPLFLRDNVDWIYRDSIKYNNLITKNVV